MDLGYSSKLEAISPLKAIGDQIGDRSGIDRGSIGNLSLEECAEHINAVRFWGNVKFCE